MAVYIIMLQRSVGCCECRSQSSVFSSPLSCRIDMHSHDMNDLTSLRFEQCTLPWLAVSFTFELDAEVIN